MAYQFPKTGAQIEEIHSKFTDVGQVSNVSNTAIDVTGDKADFVAEDSGKTFVQKGAGTFTIPDTASFPEGWMINVLNRGTLTMAASVDTISPVDTPLGVTTAASIIKDGTGQLYIFGDLA